MLAIYRKRLRRKTPAVMYPEGVGGREVCSPTAAGRKEYKRRTEDLERRQKHRCAICLLVFMRMQLDHQDGRGHGGGHRDDRIVINGEWHNAALCDFCNKNKASRRYRWKNGKYVPVVMEQFKETA